MLFVGSFSMCVALAASVVGQLRTSPDFITKQGVSVFVRDGVSQSQHEIERTIDIAIERMALTLGVPAANIRTLITQTHYEMHARELTWGDEGSCPTDSDPKRRCYGFYCGDAGTFGWCDGYFSAFVHRVDYVARNCIGDSALPHELVHFIGFLVDGDPGDDHMDPSLFPDACQTIGDTETRTACYRGSAERQIQNVVRAELCATARLVPP